MGEAPVTMLLPSPAQECAHRVLCCWGRQHVTPPGVSGCEEVFATRMQTSLLTGEAGKQQKKRGLWGCFISPRHSADRKGSDAHLAARSCPSVACCCSAPLYPAFRGAQGAAHNCTAAGGAGRGNDAVTAATVTQLGRVGSNATTHQAGSQTG